MKVEELCQSIQVLAQIVDASGPSELGQHFRAVSDAFAGNKGATVGAFVKNLERRTMDADGSGERLRVLLPTFTKLVELMTVSSNKTTASELTSLLGLLTANKNVALQTFLTVCQEPAKAPAARRPRKAKAAVDPSVIRSYADKLEQSYQRRDEFYVIFEEVKKLSAATQIDIAKEFTKGTKPRSGLKALERIEEVHTGFVEREREDRASKGRTAA